MRSSGHAGTLRRPELSDQAEKLASYLKTLDSATIARVMHVSAALADKIQELARSWSSAAEHQSLAIDSFVGDIYSGLQAGTLNEDDRAYADEHLRILSGLYGVIRPLDGICPYRLEMGYRLPDKRYANLYDYWGDRVARTLPTTGPVINVSSVEYAQVVLPFVDPNRVVTPKFLTFNPETRQPEFVVVHAKIARGAFAHWMIKTRSGVDELAGFDEIGYRFDANLSTITEPVFICKTFEGKGLSIRLT